MQKQNNTVRNKVEHLFRVEAGKINAVLIRLFGFARAELAEDIIQDTFYTALKTWSYNDIPDNPSAWLMQVAKNKTLNVLKREQKKESYRTGNDRAETSIDELFLDHEIRDSQLRILFTCCHPSLSEKARIILTLKTLCGFSYAEIAGGLLMTESAVKKSLYRSRQVIRGVLDQPEIPLKKEAQGRVEEARTVLYLMFNEGYKTTRGHKLIREELCIEAARLAKLLLEMVPSNNERGHTNALLALFHFNLARFEARIDNNGDIIDLGRQNRDRWSRPLINTGFQYLKKSRSAAKPGRYHLEAAIASVHCSAKSLEDTDWTTILGYYDRLLKLMDSPILAINRAIVLSYCGNIKDGLDALEEIKNEWAEPPRAAFQYYASKADMYRRKGDHETARSYYRVSLDYTDSVPQRKFIRKKIQECDRKNISEN